MYERVCVFVGNEQGNLPRVEVDKFGSEQTETGPNSPQTQTYDF